MEVCVTVFRHVVVDDNVDTFNIHATTEQIRRYENTLLEIFELSVTRDAFFLGHGTVNRYRGEVL